MFLDLDALIHRLLQAGLGQGGVGRRGDLGFGTALDQAHQTLVFAHIERGAVEAALQAQGLKKGGGHLRERVEFGFAQACFCGALIGLGQFDAAAEFAPGPQGLLHFANALALLGV